jgi:hypothetical protein
MSESRFGDSDNSRAAESPGQSPFGPGSPFVEYYRPPRLGIIHLLAWTAATAVLLKFSLAMEMLGDTGGGSLPEGMSIFRQIVGFIYSTAHAAGIVGAGILLLAKISRAPGRLQPGHWLLLVATVAWFLFLSIQGVFVLAQSAGLAGNSAFVWLLAAFGAVEILCAALYFYAALAFRHGMRWTICFGLLTVVDALLGLRYLCNPLLDFPWSLGFSPLWSLFVGLVLLVTVLVDLRHGPRRDWLHWLGIAIVATAVAISVAWWVWSIFAMRLMR